MVDWSAHYDAIYTKLGVDALLYIFTDPTDLRVIDKTSGVEISAGGDLSVITIEPACAVRAAELAERGVELTALKGSHITFNGGTWRIENRRPKPSPAGEGEGEMFLILIKDDDA
jgi:hypothetical protein